MHQRLILDIDARESEIWSWGIQKEDINRSTGAYM